MEKPQIPGWEVTKSEKGVEMATLNRDSLTKLLEYVEHLEKLLSLSVGTYVTGVVSEYQCCPKCAGEGRIPTTGTSTNTHLLCDVCNGSKILIKPVWVKPSLDEETQFGIQVFRNVQMASKVELILKPEYMNTVFTWNQIQDAIMADNV